MSTTGRAFYGHLLTVAVFVGIAVAWALLILGTSGSLPGARAGYVLNADVPTSALLTPGARVTVAGADVGRVTKVEVSASGSGAHVRMRLTDKRVTPVPADSRIQIRTRTQVGENYVSILIGKDTRMLASGQWATADPADEQVAVDQVLSTLQGPTKANARRFIQGLGGGVSDQGSRLNATLNAMNQTVKGGNELVAVLYRDRDAVAQLVDKLGRVTTAVGERGQAIDTIARRGLVTLQAVGRQDRSLAALLHELPATLAQVRSTSSVVGDVSARAAPVVRNLAAATAEVRPAIRNLTPAGRDGRAVLQELNGAAPRLERTLNALQRASKPLAGALPSLRTSFCQLNPLLRYAAPYTEDIFPIFVGLGSAPGSYDATGHLLRLYPIYNENSLSGAPDSVNAAATTLVNSGLLTKSKLINYDPFAPAGISGKTVATSSQPSGPESLRKSGYKYPHVKADC